MAWNKKLCGVWNISTKIITFVGINSRRTVSKQTNTTKELCTKRVKFLNS